ncbi:hypothetical protein PIB30_081190 [Stylosanthes scabra]|uniref:Uncharacterized protein n=1 Tax=Stylosanthes scabra TaxID=79078 RepID=A0ABU6VQ53_9FABA|nr:hypothetical protein [Stylosanthes scabra]
MRQFGLAQGIPGKPQSLGGNHNECLTGPKNKNWLNEYRDWIGVPLDDYMTWHNGNYKAFLNLSAFDANQGHHDDTGGPKEEPEQSQQANHVHIFHRLPFIFLHNKNQCVEACHHLALSHIPCL